MATVDSSFTFATWVASNSPDSIASAPGEIWVAYTNGAGTSSTGGSGGSTVVEYNSDTGAVINSYSFPLVYVDGLKFDPFTHQVWVMQNQDGNSALSFINPDTGVVTGPLTYANPSPTQGYDDVVFEGNATYMSYTNPPDASGDATLVSLAQDRHPTGPIVTTPVFFNGVMGLDTVTGKMELIPQNDPDSIKSAPNGDILFTSGDDGVIIDIHHLGKPDQLVTFTPIQGVPTPGAGLDDVIQTNYKSGTFFITVTGSNQVLEVHVSGLNPHDYYAAVSSLDGGAFGEVDPATGVLTPLLTGLTGIHGLTFVPDQQGAAATAPGHDVIDATTSLVGHAMHYAEG
jgi:hypothetical protein